MKRFNNCAATNRKRRRLPCETGQVQKYENLSLEKPRARARTRSRACARVAAAVRELICTSTHGRTLVLTYIYTHAYGPHPRAGGSPRRVAFYIFIPRSPFFPPTDPPRARLPLPPPGVLVATRLGERTSTQSTIPAEPAFPVSLAARHPRHPETVFHIQNVPRVAFSYPPRRLRAYTPGPVPRPTPRARRATSGRARSRVSLGRNIKHGSYVGLPVICVYAYTRASSARGTGFNLKNN